MREARYVSTGFIKRQGTIGDDLLVGVVSRDEEQAGIDLLSSFSLSKTAATSARLLSRCGSSLLKFCASSVRESRT